jgi:AAA15 family ATPase/GTPase
VLVEFRVRNFRSFRDEAVLNLTASSDSTNASTNLIETGNRSVPRLLRAVGIYGANASGKSNLIRAMQLLRVIVADSATLQPGQAINVQPFRLDPVTEEQPVEYEVSFLTEAVRFQFGFSVTSNRIVTEWLIAYKTIQPATWYERSYDSKNESYEYKFGSQLLGSRAVWRDATRPNALFLSTAVQLNSEQLRPVFDWIVQSLVVFENGAAPSLDYTVAHIANNEARAVKRFLASADISIEDIEIKTQPGFQQSLKFDLATGQIEQTPREQRDVSVPLFRHASKVGSAIFGLQDESQGTQKLFALAGPLFEIFQRGRVLIVDELDRSLHALLVRQLIEMFQDPEVNINGAQLIFTTHDTSLLDGGLLRRDQVWFTEKNEDQASNLYPLTDFSPRKSEALERGYLAGRYGAIPVLKRLRT